MSQAEVKAEVPGTQAALDDIRNLLKLGTQWYM